MAKPVLVTSAAGGNQGKTGRHVSEMLLARGVAVRALVRKIDERSDHLKSLGAEIFVGDFLDVRSMQQAVKRCFVGLLCLSGSGWIGGCHCGHGRCGARGRRFRASSTS